MIKQVIGSRSLQLESSDMFSSWSNVLVEWTLLGLTLEAEYLTLKVEQNPRLHSSILARPIRMFN